MKQISSSSGATNKIKSQNKNTTHKQHNSVEDLELELLEQEAFEKAYYLHMAYSNY